MNYPNKAFDCFAGTLSSKQLAQMNGSGYDAVWHYYSHSPSKNLTKASAILTTNAGLEIGAVWEAQGDQISQFSSHYGSADAEAALALATQCEQPLNSAIYFAVDTGPSASQITNNILPYFAAVKALLNGKYKIGCYGCGDVLTALEKAGLIDYFWLAGAMGWPGSRAYEALNKAHVVQGQPVIVNGLDIDPDTIYKECGLFTVKG